MGNRICELRQAAQLKLLAAGLTMPKPIADDRGDKNTEMDATQGAENAPTAEHESNEFD